MPLEDFSNYGSSNERKVPPKKEEDILNIHESIISPISPVFPQSKTNDHSKKSFLKNKKSLLWSGIVIGGILLGIGGFLVFHSSSMENGEQPLTSQNPIQSSKSPVVSFYDHKYQIVNEKVSWQEAFSQASEAGGYLATLNTLDEEAFLDALVQDSPLEEYWIGGYFDYEYRQGFSWITGEPWNYENWVNRLYYTDPEILANLDVVAIEKASLEWDLLEDNEKTTAGYIIEWGNPDYSEVPYEEEDIDNYVISEDIQKIIDAAEVIFNLFQ